jgi:hypothetical protein
MLFPVKSSPLPYENPEISLQHYFYDCTHHPYNIMYLSVRKHDNGNHKGWYKNNNNPHHPNSTNPGKVKGKRK